MANGSEYGLQTTNDSMIESEVVSDDVIALVVGNTVAQTDCKQQDLIDIEHEYDSID